MTNIHKIYQSGGRIMLNTKTNENNVTLRNMFAL